MQINAGKSVSLVTFSTSGNASKHCPHLCPTHVYQVRLPCFTALVGNANSDVLRDLPIYRDAPDEVLTILQALQKSEAHRGVCLTYKVDFYIGKLRTQVRRGALIEGRFPFQVVGAGIFTEGVQLVFGKLVPPRNPHPEIIRRLPGQLRLRLPRLDAVALAGKLLRALLVRSKAELRLETQ